MNTATIKIWNDLSKKEKQQIFAETAAKMEGSLQPAAIEKDWWVTRTLELVFASEISPYTVFKGGTSLSKAWSLIDRFSEDIDLALDRKFLQFGEEMTPSQVKKLRKTSFKYISGIYFPLLQKAFVDAGLWDVSLKLNDIKSNDEDPVKIEVYYLPVTERLSYLQPKVLIEIGSRSLKEPFTERKFCSFVGEHFKGRNFADATITIPTVNPERTFLEKIFLLHEEFQQPEEKIKVERRSRHLYDIGKMMDTQYSEKALTDKNLYQHIVEHRRTITPLRGIDYANHSTNKISFIPPASMIGKWEKDYKQMQESMIYKQSLPFHELIAKLQSLQNRINKLKY